MHSQTPKGVGFFEDATPNSIRAAFRLTLGRLERYELRQAVTLKPNLHGFYTDPRGAPHTRLQGTNGLGSSLIRIIAQCYQYGCVLRFIPDAYI